MFYVLSAVITPTVVVTRGLQEACTTDELQCVGFVLSVTRKVCVCVPREFLIITVNGTLQKRITKKVKKKPCFLEVVLIFC